LEEKEEEFEDLTEWLKETFDEKVSKVVLSDRLEDTPMIVVTTKYGYSANMERIARGQAFGSRSPQKSTKILEINFRHPTIKALQTMIQEESDSERAVDLANLMLDSALLQSGFIIESDAVQAFASRVERIVREGLDVDLEEEVEAMPEFPDDDEFDDDDEDEDDEDEDDDEYLDDDDWEDEDKDEL